MNTGSLPMPLLFYIGCQLMKESVSSLLRGYALCCGRSVLKPAR